MCNERSRELTRQEKKSELVPALEETDEDEFSLQKRKREKDESGKRDGAF